MNISSRPFVVWTIWLLGAVFSVLGSTSVHAQISCTPSMSDLVFGTVDPLSSLTNATATLTFNCTNSNNNSRAATLCFSIGEPGGAQTNPRRLSSGANFLNFQLYRDSTYSTVWGSTFFGSNTPLQVNVTVPGKSSVSVPGSATMYGRVLAGQTSAVPGAYTRIYQSGDTALRINQNNNNTAPGSCGNTVGGAFPFDVSATVIKSCTVTAGAASDIQIGPASGVPVDAVNSSGTNSIGVTCSGGTAYFIGLKPSNNNTAGLGAMSGTGANTDKVPYQLRSVSASGPIWGNTATATSVGNGVAGIGTGVAQSVPVFAVAPSANFTPDNYSDIVTVTVNY
ncbi:MAG: spore coat U domain-containing protein [Burkholderiales bacterium]|nr:spore coat U domain-containing protein [Burkholderiales bacterium]